MVSHHMPRCRGIGLLCVTVATFLGGSGLALSADPETPADFVWLEGEQPSAANIEVQRSGWGNTQFLSEGKWLHCSIDADKVDASVPDEGVSVEVHFSDSARHELPDLEPDWVRICAVSLRLAHRRGGLEARSHPIS